MRCQKIRYPTEQAAWEALDELDQKRKRGKKEASVYKCHRCKGWHTTSQLPRWVRKSK